MKLRKLVACLLCTVMCLSALPLTFPLQVSAMDQAEFERNTYLKPSAGPMEKEPSDITLSKGGTPAKEPNYVLSLDGTWKMTSSGKLADLIAGSGWDSAYDATVPGSIYTALMEAGVMADPYLGTNMIDANKYSSRSWYFLRTFTYEGAGRAVRLNFDGLCNVADVYLNGQKVASHEGMFGGPYVDVSDIIRKGENTLVVHLKPAKDYNQTVVFNCSYGWHYAKLYPLGIWQSVSVEELPTVEIDAPFVSTYDYTRGTVDMSIELNRLSGSRLSGTLTGVITPKNFEGASYTFTTPVDAGGADSTAVRLRCDIPDPHLWWPAGYGAQNLYTLTVTWQGKDGSADTETVDFGIRELAYQSYPGGESTGVYNRTIVINGQPVFMKGAGWCTIDAMMRFEREDYDRILSRARDAGINFLRAWGGGLVETNEFYDLCDEYGICVYQEWPCCWDSQNTQPADVLRETVKLGAKRLRSRASLIVWGGGNEGVAPYSDAMLNEIGRLTYEYDGTRVFWRQDGGIGGGGITHDHIHWSGASPEHYLTNYADFKNLNLMEYGLDGMMNLDSIAKFATEGEMTTWPIARSGTVAYHTATFNGTTGWTATPYGYDVDTFIHYASTFLEVNGLEDMVLGSQLAQAQADYLAAQNSRMNNPYSTTVCVYKLNDVYPGGSWALVDWYGAPKIAYYLMQDAYRPLMAAGKFTCYNTATAAGEAQPFEMPVYMLDDADALATGIKWEVRVTAYDSTLSVVKTQTYAGSGSVDRVKEVGNFYLDAEQTDSTPLIITVDLMLNGQLYNRSYTYMNYEAKQGSLFYLPRTHLTWSVNGNSVTVTNTGKLPALSVYFQVDDTSSFVCEDNYFFLAAGESVTIKVNDASAIRGVSCFNLADPADKTAPTVPADTAVTQVGSDSATLTWSPSEDDVSLYGYYVYLNGERVDFVQAGKTAYTFTGLREVSQYHVTVEAVDDNMNTSGKARGYTFTTAADATPPQMKRAVLNEDGTITVTFDKVLDKDSAENTAFYLLSQGASVTGATLGEDGMTVTLTTDGMQADKVYTLGAVGIRDNGYNRNRMGYTEIVLDRGLYMAIPFEPDQNGLLHTSGQLVKPVTAMGSGAWAEEGIQGGGWACTGGGASIEPVDYTFGQGMTVSMWYNGGTAAGFQVLLAKGPKTNGHFEFYLRSGQLFFYAPEVGDIDLHVTLPSGGWHHLAFLWQDNRMLTYIDGQKAGSVTVSGTISQGANTLAVGSLSDGSLPFAGTIDEVKLYTRLLTQEELAAEAKYQAPVADVSGDDCGTTQKTDFTFADGETVNLWFSADGFKDFNIMLACNSKSTNRHFEIYTEQGILKFYAPSEPGGVAVSFGVQMNTLVGGWHMLTVTHEKNTLTAYIDGRVVGSTITGFAATEGEATLAIGKLVEGGFNFNGRLTEVELLNTLLTPEEIIARYKEKMIYPTPDGTLSFAESVLRLTEGAEAPLGLDAENVPYALTVDGDAVTVSEGTIRAVRRGVAVIRAISDDGRSMSAAVVDVLTEEDELPPVDTTPIPDPETGTEPDTEPETGTSPETDPSSDTVTPGESDPITEPDATESETQPDKKKGCSSGLSAALSILMFPALALLVRKKKQ